MYREDYLMRIVRQLAEAVTRAISLRAKAPEEALKAIEDAKRLLPLVPGALDTLGAATVLKLLGSTETALGLAQLYRAEVSVRAQLGDREAAGRSTRRALQFFVEARRAGGVSAEEIGHFRELAQLHVPPGALTSEWREAVDLTETT